MMQRCDPIRDILDGCLTPEMYDVTVAALVRNELDYSFAYFRGSLTSAEEAVVSRAVGRHGVRLGYDWQLACGCLVFPRRRSVSAVSVAARAIASLMHAGLWPLRTPIEWSSGTRVTARDVERAWRSYDCDE